MSRQPLLRVPPIRKATQGMCAERASTQALFVPQVHVDGTVLDRSINMDCMHRALHCATRNASVLGS